MMKAFSSFVNHFSFSPSSSRGHVATSLLLLLLMIVIIPVGGTEDNECDYILSDSPKEGKVVHTFHTSCQEGEIMWRYPFSGIEITFNRPVPLSYILALRLSDDDDNDGGGDDYDGGGDDDDDDLEFCYVVSMTNVNVTMMREMPGPRFQPSEKESCLTLRSLAYNPLKFYIESTQSLKSSLIGKFQLIYAWSKPTPYEQCRSCTTRELSTAVCTAGNLFTGRIERPGKNRSSLAVSVSKILRFDVTNLPKRFCIQRRGTPTTTTPSPHHRGRKDGVSFFQHHKCDRVVIPQSVRCPHRQCPHGRCPHGGFPLRGIPDEEFMFVADTSLQRFKPRCILPVVEFWKMWRSMEARDETDCLLVDDDYH